MLYILDVPHFINFFCFLLLCCWMTYSKHPHIRTLFSGLRLIMFLFEGCLVRNQPKSVLKMFLKLVSDILQIIY